LSCIGNFTSAKGRLTALKQSQAVCDYAESINGNLATNVSVKKTKFMERSTEITTRKSRFFYKESAEFQFNKALRK
jgi:hypothetical protein